MNDLKILCADGSVVFVAPALWYQLTDEQRSRFIEYHETHALRKASLDQLGDFMRELK